MVTKIAINGFGRIGRNILRAIVEDRKENLDVIAINDSGSIETNIHLLKYDSVHGRFPKDIDIYDMETINISGKHIKKLSNRNPETLPWKDLDIDIVLECTGKFNHKDLAIWGKESFNLCASSKS